MPQRWPLKELLKRFICYILPCLLLWVNSVFLSKTNSSAYVLDPICSCVLKCVISALFPPFGSSSFPSLRGHTYMSHHETLRLWVLLCPVGVLFLPCIYSKTAEELPCVPYLLCFSSGLSIRCLPLFPGRLLLSRSSMISRLLDSVFNTHLSSWPVSSVWHDWWLLSWNFSLDI